MIVLANSSIGALGDKTLIGGLAHAARDYFARDAAGTAALLYARGRNAEEESGAIHSVESRVSGIGAKNWSCGRLGIPTCRKQFL